MSRRIPVLDGRERPPNLATLMREAFVALNDLVLARLAEHGHADVRPAHGAVFQYAIRRPGPSVRPGRARSRSCRAGGRSTRR